MSSLLNCETVTAVLQQHLHPEATCINLTRAAAGNSQETWFISVGGIEHPTSLVLRRSAVGGTIEWSDRGIEVAVLQAASKAGLPVPKVWWWEPDGSQLERSYSIMDRAPGENPDLKDPKVCSTLAEDLGRWLARLHMQAEAPDELERPEAVVDATRTQVDLWTARARTSGMAPSITAALCGWLAAHIPVDAAQPVLLWGDPGPHNVLTDSDGKITALLDWELAHVGHPLLDLGAARWACLGHLDREVLTVTYERETGTEIQRDALNWFEVLACVSRSTMLFDGVRAVVDGRAHEPNLAALGLAMVGANMLRAADLAWGISPVDNEITDAELQPAMLRPLRHERDHALARFLNSDVLPAVSDLRVRRGLKIAAALLSIAPLGVASTDNVVDPWTSYDRELEGEATHLERQILVAGMALERHHHQALLELYGATVMISPDKKFRT